MIILDKPYISPFLQETVMKNKIPTLINEKPSNLGILLPLNYLTQEKFIELYKNGDRKTIYTNSENALQWINSHLDEHELTGQIDNFKDKFKFRTLMQPFYDDYIFQKVKFNFYEKYIILLLIFVAIYLLLLLVFF